MSKLTKQALVDSFLRLAAVKPIDKITVRDIVDGCGLNRNTFYYYYSDIYALLEELLVTETERAIGRSRETGSLSEGCVAIVEWIEAHRDAFRNIYTAIGRESVEYAMSKVLDPAIENYVRLCAGKTELREGDAQILTAVCRSVFFGSLADWMRHNLKDYPREYFVRVERMFGGSIPEAIRIAATLPAIRLPE